MAGREQIVEEMQNIMNKRLQKGTRSMYERAYKSFKTYEQNVPNDKSRGEKILMFLTEIFTKKKYTAASVQSIWAGIKSCLAEKNEQVAPEMLDRIQKLLAGMKKMSKPGKTPQPMKLQQLNYLIRQCRKLSERD